MKKIIALISAISLVGALFVAPTQAAVGDKIVIQAEETAGYKYVHNNYSGEPDVTGTISQGVVALDQLPAWYATKGGVSAQPKYGETGDGVKIADWGADYNSIYAIKLRSRDVAGHQGVKSVTYKVNAPATGTYSLAASTFCWYEGSYFHVSVNNGDVANTATIAVSPSAGWEVMIADANNFTLNENLLDVDLVKGENTITIAAWRSISVDKFELTCKSVEEEPSKDVAEITVQSEETASITVNGVAKNGLPTIAAIGNAGDYPNYYGVSAEQATRGETGKGILINDTTKAYGVTLRPANKGLDGLTYKVTAPFAGTYKLSMRTGLFATTYPKVAVNGQDAISITNLQVNLSNYTAAFVWNDDVAEVELVAGENTITFTPGSQPFYFDCFKLVGEAPIPTYDLVDYGTIQKDKVAEGAFYSVKVSEVEDELTLGVEGKDFTITGLGSFDVKTALTYAILGYTTPSTDITISSGETVYKAE